MYIKTYYLYLPLSGLIAALFLAACLQGGGPSLEPEACVWDGVEEVDFLHSIGCRADFERLEGKPLSQAFGEVECIKLVYIIETDSLLFMESKKYPAHYFFCKKVLGYSRGQQNFNRDQYAQSENRIYHLASINHYSASDIHTLEFASGDKITSGQIREVFEAVRKKCFFGKNLKFMASGLLEERAAELEGQIPVISIESVYKGQTYQPLNKEKGYGYLVKIDIKDVESSYISRRSIVVTNGVPNDISVVSGIITSEFQTPLSHINVLSQNRKTPNMASRNAWDSPLIQSLLGKLVFFEVAQDSFTLREAALSEAEAFWAVNDPKETATLPLNDSTPGIFDIAELGHNNIGLVGAKAANFAELAKINAADPGPIPLPEGAFAIPFYYYRNHLKRNGLDVFINTMLQDSGFTGNQETRKIILDSLRTAIKASPLDTGLLRLVIRKIEGNGGYRRMRFRSSTNAEDVPGFNGAGLYSSHTGSLDHPGKTVAAAIKKVWAGVWNFRAYEERDYFKIKHRRVAMGVLVHRSFPDELANGAAITANLYNRDLPGFTINVQHGEISVVTPPHAGITCDQAIFHTAYDNPYEQPVIEYITHSNIIRKGTVLSDSEMARLAKYLGIIKSWFHFNVYGADPNKTLKDFAMDVEFKFDRPDRKLYIKQARPY